MMVMPGEKRKSFSEESREKHHLKAGCNGADVQTIDPNHSLFSQNGLVSVDGSWAPCLCVGFLYALRGGRSPPAVSDPYGTAAGNGRTAAQYASCGRTLPWKTSTQSTAMLCLTVTDNTTLGELLTIRNLVTVYETPTPKMSGCGAPIATEEC